MTKTIHGRIHGKTIELDEDLGVAEGQEVEVQVKIIQPSKKWGKASCARQELWPMIRNGMPSWRRSTRPARSNVGHGGSLNDAPTRHQ